MELTKKDILLLMHKQYKHNHKKKTKKAYKGFFKIYFNKFVYDKTINFRVYLKCII